MDNINFTRQQCCNAGRRGLDRGVDNFRDLAGVETFAPVIGIGRQDSLFVDRATHQFECAGAISVHSREVGLALGNIVRGHDVVRFSPTLVHHEHVGQIVDQ